MPEEHPLKPFLPPEARILMCGTFPPPRKRWSMEFYYPNYINDMWRVFGLVFFGDKDYFVDAVNRTFRLPELKAFLTERGIALSDTGGEVERLRGNASDKFLNITRPFPLAELLGQLSRCTDLATTGEKAASIAAALTGTDVPKVGEYVEAEVKMPDGTMRPLRHWRMPSTSRAYPLPLTKKAELYARLLKRQ